MKQRLIYEDFWFPNWWLENGGGDPLGIELEIGMGMRMRMRMRRIVPSPNVPHYHPLLQEWSKEVLGNIFKCNTTRTLV